MRRFALLTLGFMVLVGPGVQAQVQEQEVPDAPPADAILDRYVAVTGGQAAYDRIQNQITVFSISQNGQELSRLTTVQTRDGRYRSIEVSGNKIKETGLNDGVAWAKTEETAELLDAGEEQAAVLRSAVLLPEGQWRRFYTDVVTVIGYGSSADPPCYEVAAMPFAGEPESLCYNPKTGLLAIQFSETQDGGEVELKLRDYFDAGGIRMAKTAEMTVNGSVFLLTVESVQFNQSIPGSTFDLPMEIARLLKKKSGG